MEIEKKRETSWKIALGNKEKNIELTSVEVGGEVRIIKFSLLKNDKSIMVEMSKEEFFNFLSLLFAFKDVVIGESLLKPEEEVELYENLNNEVQNEINSDVEKEDNEFESIDESFNEDFKEELDPEEWDPW